MDTRPILNDALFEEKSVYVEEYSWQTGEAFIHVDAVTDVEGWSQYGSPGFNSLTTAQQTIMMWSDLVGQVSNGGFLQFCENFRSNLDRAVASVAELAWPNLKTHFDSAMIEQAGSLGEPNLLRPGPITADAENWEESKVHYATLIARANKPKWRPMFKSDVEKVRKAQSRMPEWLLAGEYITAVEDGRVPGNGEPYFNYNWPSQEAAEAFDSWFYSDECKQESRIYVKNFIIENKAKLCRVS